jgi:hypothetical protein
MSRIRPSVVVSVIVTLVATLGGVTLSSVQPRPAGAAGGGTSKSPAELAGLIGTKEALASPNCDSTTGTIKVPIKYAPPCTVPWQGRKNGGATSPGVTKDTIKIVVVAGAVNDTDPDRDEVAQMWRDVAAIYQNTYQTYGRKVEIIFKDFGPGQLPDETQERAMAVEIAALKPFAVVAHGGGDVLAQELAKRKIVTIQQGVSFDTAVASDPYAWGGLASGIPEPLLAITAKYIAQRLAGKPAEWAGDPTYQKKKRVFGLIVNDTVDKKVYESYFKKYKVPLASVVTYAATLGPQFAEQAPTMIQKLRSAGVTTVINVVPYTDNKSLTEIATQQEFFPEWFLTGSFSQDISLLGRTFDEKQWSHAFGLGTYPPVPTELAWYNHLTDWYYGTDKPDYRTAGDVMKRPNLIIAQYLVLALFTGIHLAGPDLTPQNFRDGMFAFEPSGGAACNCITTSELSYGDHGLLPGYLDYFAPDDVVEIYWDAERVAPDELAGITGKGLYMYMNGGRRFNLATVPKGEPHPFDPSTAIDSKAITQLPANDRVPDYPCDNCPSAKTSS